MYKSMAGIFSYGIPPDGKVYGGQHGGMLKKCILIPDRFHQLFGIECCFLEYWDIGAGGQKKSYTKINLPMSACKQVHKPSTNKHKGRLSKAAEKRKIFDAPFRCGLLSLRYS